MDIAKLKELAARGGKAANVDVADLSGLIALVERQEAELAEARKAAESTKAGTFQADVKRMVDRFLSWPLPVSVFPDPVVWDRSKSHRYGTNLLTADQAEAMFRYALDGVPVEDVILPGTFASADALFDAIDSGSSVYIWLCKVRQNGTPQAKQAAQILKDYYEGVDTDGSKPKGCSSDPSNCPDNEGYGCACSKDPIGDFQAEARQQKLEEFIASVPAEAPGKPTVLDTPDSMANSNARFAIDGAIQYGRENRNKPPSDDHWLMEYWLIGQQLRELGKTGWDNRTPLDPAEKVAIAAPQQRAQAALSDGDIAIISGGLKIADVLIDMIPTRLQEHDDESIARIGELVNIKGGYNAIASAKRCFGNFAASRQSAAAPDAPTTTQEAIRQWDSMQDAGRVQAAAPSKFGSPELQAMIVQHAVAAALSAQQEEVQCQAIRDANKVPDSELIQLRAGFRGQQLELESLRAECRRHVLNAKPDSGRDAALPDGWRETLLSLRNNTETFGPYLQETARIAIEGCIDALDDIAAQSTENAAVQSLTDAEKLDAARYRWLRSDDIEVLPGQREILVYMERLPNTEDSDILLLDSELDAAIDAQIAAASAKGGA